MLLLKHIHTCTQLGDKDAMVGALRQQDLDADKFLCAPRSVMQTVLQLIESKYGGVSKYLNANGFGAEWQQKLRKALIQP